MFHEIGQGTVFLYYLNFVNRKQQLLAIFLPSFSEKVLIWFLNQCRVYLICHLKEGYFSRSGKALDRGTQLYKNKGKRSDINHYRPISTIPVVAKMFERIIYDQLYKYLTDSKLLSGHQSAGFLSAHPTVTALLEATDSWSLSIDLGNVNAVVFLGLKKAFDTVDHTLLLSKLDC